MSLKSLSCPNRECSLFGKTGQENVVVHGFYRLKSGKRRRCRCRSCGTTFCSTKGTPYFRLQHRLHDLQPIGCLIYFATPVIHDRRLLGIQPAPIDYWRTSRGPRVWHWSDER